MNKPTPISEEETVSTVTKRRKKDTRYYIKSVWRSAERTKGFSKDKAKQEYLRKLLEDYGDPGFIPACSGPARTLLSELLVKSILSKYHHELKPNGMYLYHATLAFEDLLTGDGNTIIKWPKAKKRVSTMMRKVSNDFIGVGEIDVLLNKNLMIDGVSQGRVLCPHFHILFWTDKNIEPRKLSEKLSKPFAANPDGMKVVKITRCADTDVDITRLVSYLFKAPQGGKTQWMKKVFNDEGVLQSANIRLSNSSKKAHRKIAFSRQAEILSHSAISSLMIAGGDGVILKRKLLRVLVETTKLLGSPPPAEYGKTRTLEFWSMMRSQGHGKNYRTPKIIS